MFLILALLGCGGASDDTGTTGTSTGTEPATCAPLEGPTVSCGDQTCAADQVCFFNGAGTVTTYGAGDWTECVPAPLSCCGTLDCACIASICENGSAAGAGGDAGCITHEGSVACSANWP